MNHFITWQGEDNQLGIFYKLLMNVPTALPVLKIPLSRSERKIMGNKYFHKGIYFGKFIMWNLSQIFLILSREYEPTVYDIEFFSGTDRLPLTRVSVEKLKSNKKLLLVFAALLLPSLAPWIFCHKRTKYYKSCYCRHYRTHRELEWEVFFRKLLQRQFAEFVSRLCIGRGKATHTGEDEKQDQEICGSSTRYHWGKG